MTNIMYDFLQVEYFDFSNISNWLITENKNIMCDFCLNTRSEFKTYQHALWVKCGKEEEGDIYIHYCANCRLKKRRKLIYIDYYRNNGLNLNYLF